MNFLLINDDGINAGGIHQLAKALGELGDVYVCAPHTQRSTTGHGITLFKPLKVKEIHFKEAVKAWECNGFPADCTKMGIFMMEKLGLKPDMIFSGINHGGNMGHDTLYSGTVAAAAEGSYFDILSVAVSVDSHEPENFEMACDLACQTVKNCYGKVKPDVVININTPDLPKDEIKGVKFSHIGERRYTDHFEPIEDNYQLVGDLIPYDGSDENCDAYLVENGYASITPLKMDLTDKDSIKMLEEMYR
ncbi:MAG: 5'/3'-nucleotidase SurE [Clostridia bacterium]|nr:5'/3'-nucleotidase SurE [Clostridia bacterium]